MDEMPEDVLRAASKWTAQCYQPETATWFDVRDVIARAILAERKRCADVAHHLNGWGADCGTGGHAEHIAKVIEGRAA